MKQDQLNILNDMGITVWVARDRNNMINKNENTIGLDAPSILTLLNPKTLKRNLSCWVLLHEELNQDEDLLNMFNGMIKVLNLPEQELCISFIPLSLKARNNHKGSNNNWNHYEDNPMESMNMPMHLPMDMKKILDAITAFAPKSLLVMGKEFGQALFDLMSEVRHLPYPVKVTYHPHELVIAPHHKRQAYQDLLGFKEMLDGN